MQFTRGLLLLLPALFAFILPAQAQQSLNQVSSSSSDIIVKDTSGFTRASSSVDGSGNVEFSLVDSSGLAADGVEVTLTNAAGDSISAVAANGTVIFEEVAPGSWTVASSVPGITFTSVEISSVAAVAGGLFGVTTTTAALVGTGSIAAGAIIIEANNDSNSNRDLSPSS